MLLAHRDFDAIERIEPLGPIDRLTTATVSSAAQRPALGVGERHRGRELDQLGNVEFGQ